MNHFEKLNKASLKIILSKNARFFKYYAFILTLKLGDNLICYGTLCINMFHMLINIDFINNKYISIS